MVACWWLGNGDGTFHSASGEPNSGRSAPAHGPGGGLVTSHYLLPLSDKEWR